MRNTEGKGVDTMTERITDIGPPHFGQFLPQIIKDNYGTWDYHEILKPGVMVHVGESGDKLFTVRAGTPRLLAVASIRSFADLADKYCGGHLRFTSAQQRRVPAHRRGQHRRR
jgi:sulfite reductase beta subunit